jgi:hypothetical protein
MNSAIDRVEWPIVYMRKCKSYRRRTLPGGEGNRMTSLRNGGCGSEGWGTMAFTLARSTSHSRHFRRLRIFDGATVVASGVYTRHLLDEFADTENSPGKP